MYKYPDINDYNLLHHVINKNWEDGGLETKYLQESLKKIPNDKKTSLLDVGCGQGRLTQQYLQHFVNIVAIDPDLARLNEAKKITNKLLKKHPEHNIAFYNDMIENLSIDKTFDCILCSHLIQHVQTNKVQEILTKMYNYLNKDGYLILSTTNWIETEDRFSSVNTITNEYFTLTEKEFNLCVQANNRTLPTRLFNDKELKELIQNANFEIIFLRKYHGYPKIRGDNFIFARKK